MNSRLGWSLFVLLLSASLMMGTSIQDYFSSIRNSVFIGQAYPSGNVYLRSFAGQRAGAFPEKLSFISLTGDSRLARKGIQQAALSKDSVPSAYIPAVEGLDDWHDSCGSGKTRATNPAWGYLSEDFFDAIVDYCSPNDALAIYRSTPSVYSVKVFAFATNARLRNVRRAAGMRSMTSRTPSADTDCTTTPATIASAMILAEGQLDGGLTLRLSFYKKPGCYGHLTGIYLVDVLRGTDVLETFQLNQNQGVL